MTTVYEDFTRREAARRGIDPDTAIGAWEYEGGFQEPARRGTFATGSSWWPPQLHYGGRDPEQYGYKRRDYSYLGTTAGMGNSFTFLTDWEPGEPKAWRDAVRYGLDEARRVGWGPWYAAKARGITGFMGIDRSVPWSGTPADEWDFKRGGGDVPTPGDVQAIQTRVIDLGRAEIGKRYAGPIINEPDAYRWGNPGWDCSSFVSAMYDRATGGQIKLTPYTDAAYRQCEWVASPVPGDIVFYNYDDDQDAVWPHMGIWLSPTEVLDARWNADPAKGGVGIHPHVTPIGPDEKGRFRRTMRPKGLANVVLAPQPGTPAPVGDPRDGVIAELQKQLADKDRRLREAVSLLGTVSGDYADGLEFIVGELRKVKPPAA